MSYTPSRCRNEFNTQVSGSLRELAYLYPFAQAHGSGSRLLALYYSFVFSQLEVYIKSLVGDSLRLVSSVSPPASLWPEMMLAYHLHKQHQLAEEYRKFSAAGDEVSLLRGITRISKEIQNWTSGTSNPAIVNVDSYLEGRGYPSPKNLQRLFNRLGITSIWAQIDPISRMNNKIVLTSLNDIRTSIVHDGVVPPGFSIIDHRNYTAQSFRLVIAIDRAIASHFCATIVSWPDWNARMT
jgi:hypothetical protein